MDKFDKVFKKEFPNFDDGFWSTNKVVEKTAKLAEPDGDACIMAIYGKFGKNRFNEEAGVDAALLFYEYCGVVSLVKLGLMEVTDTGFTLTHKGQETADYLQEESEKGIGA